MIEKKPIGVQLEVHGNKVFAMQCRDSCYLNI